MSHISVDFETFFSTKLKYGLRTMIAEEYCRHELFEPYLISICNGAATWAGDCNNFNWDAINGQVWVSHNRYFDNSVFNEMKRRGMIPGHVAPSAWHCTANLTSYICNRRALKDAIEKLYPGQVISKEYRGTANNKHWPQDYSAAEREQVLAAGRQDAWWCWKLWEDHSAQWPEWEQQLSNLTIDQGMRGVQIDVDLLNQYLLQTHEMRTNTEAVIPWIADSEDEDYDWDEFATEIKRKPTSTKCIAEQCRLKSIPVPPVKSKDEEGYEAWELEYGKDHQWIHAVGAWRSINKLYTTFLTMKRRIRSDGTMPFALKYFGAHTGRWSGDAKINFQNMRKQPIFCRLDGLLQQDDILVNGALDYFDANGKWPEWVKYAIDFRALIKARPGYKMIACDLSQIEPRVLAWLSGNKDLLEKIRNGMGVYEAFARSQMGYTGPKFTSAFKRTDEYKLIKIQVLQLGYGAGWEKFITTALKESGLDLTKDDPKFIEVPTLTDEVKKVSGYGTFSKKVVASFREQNPLVTGLWEAMDNGYRGSLGSDYVVALPSGRKLRYEHVKAQTKITADKETGKPKKKTEFTADVGGKRAPFYGGKLVANATSGTARDVFALLILRLAAAGHINLFSCHDEAVLECKPEITAKEIEQEMSWCPPWLEGAPIAAEAKELEHYCK